MASFDISIEYVLDNEDRTRSGKVIRDNDGGVCRWGLNSKSNPDLLTIYGFNLERLDLPAAKIEYWKRYWLPIMDQLKSQRVAAKLLDLMVNAGKETATILLQQAVTQLGLHLICDGNFGPTTLMLTNAVHEDDLLNELCRQAYKRYTHIVAEHPEDKPYLNDWLARAAKIPELTKAVTQGG